MPSGRERRRPSNSCGKMTQDSRFRRQIGTEFGRFPAMLNAADLPDDVAALKAMLIAAQARERAKDVAIASKDEHIARKDERIERLEKLVAAFKQAAFGRKSEKTDPDQFDLALEDLETAMAAIHAEDEADTPAGTRTNRPRAIKRGSLPKHLPRVEEVIKT